MARVGRKEARVAKGPRAIGVARYGVFTTVLVVKHGESVATLEQLPVPRRSLLRLQCRHLLHERRILRNAEGKPQTVLALPLLGPPGHRWKDLGAWSRVEGREDDGGHGPFSFGGHEEPQVEPESLSGPEAKTHQAILDHAIEEADAPQLPPLDVPRCRRRTTGSIVAKQPFDLRPAARPIGRTRYLPASSQRQRVWQAGNHRKRSDAGESELIGDDGRNGNRWPLLRDRWAKRCRRDEEQSHRENERAHIGTLRGKRTLGLVTRARVFHRR